MAELDDLKARVEALEAQLRPSNDPRWSARNWVVSHLAPGVRELFEVISDQYKRDHPGTVSQSISWRAT